MNFLHRYKESLGEVSTFESLNEICQQFHLRLRSLNLHEMDPILLDNITLHLCLKIVVMCMDCALPPQTKELVEFLLDQRILTEFPAKLMQMLLDKSLDRTYQLPNKTERQDLGAQVASCLDVLLRDNNKADRYVHKNYGQAIIDLNGDFIWADQNSEKFFEMRLKEMKNTNFFDLMIPFSRKYIFKKFGGNEIFSREKNVFSSVAFSYVIYSKTSMNKFSKRLQEKNHRDPDAVDDNVLPEEREMGNYYKYLKALSSKATLVPIKFTRAEIKDIISSQKYNICVTEGLRSVMDDLHNSKPKEGGKRKAEPPSKSLMEVDPDFSLKDKSEDNPDVICKLAIILETRAAKNTPAFPYSKMSHDPKIIEFKEKIRKKLF